MFKWPGPLQTAHQLPGHSFSFQFPAQACRNTDIHIHSYIQRSSRAFNVLQNEPSFEFLSQLTAGQRSKWQRTLNINRPSAKKQNIILLHTSHSRNNSSLSLSGPISEEVSGHSASGLVMSPAAQYRHRAGTAEGRQSWQDGATGTYYI